MREFTLAAIFLSCSATDALSVDVLPTYFCASELAAGLSPKSGRWTATEFSAPSKYTVSPKSTSEGGITYEIRELGNDVVLHSCRGPSSDSGGFPPEIVCGGMGFGLRINIKTMRFIEVYTHGYLENDLTGRNTPSITAGTCSKISG